MKKSLIFPFVYPYLRKCRCKTQTTHGGGTFDVFVTKLNSTGTVLIYSTYIGGSSYEEGYSIVIDGSGNVYVTGNTNSTDYDITAGAFKTTHGGNSDVFVMNLGLSGNASVDAISQDVKAFSIYPNPNNGNFFIQSDKPAIFELTDIMGKLINTYECGG